MTPAQARILALSRASDAVLERDNAKDGYRQALIDSAILWGQALELAKQLKEKEKKQP